MASYVYADGKYHMLAGNKIANNGELLAMKHTDRIVADGEDYPLGVATVDVDEPTIPDVPDAPEPALTTLVHEQGDEPTGGTVWYISPDGAGNMDGTSWTNAASQSMIHAILLSTVSGDRLYFMEGTYDGVTRPITVPSGVSLYGGFSSADTSWGARDAFNHQTICQPANFTGTFAEIAEAVTGQVIDGFVLIGYTDTSSDGTNITYRNMTVNGGEFLTLGDVYNCQFVDCALTVNDAEKVIVSSTEAKNMTVTGSLTNVTVSLNGGTLTCGSVASSHIVESNITAGTVSESVIVNTTAITNVTGDVNTSTIYGETAVVGNITECDIYGDVTCQGNITGNTDKNTITGKVVCDSIINYVCEGSVEAFSKIENCVSKSTATSLLGTDNVYTTQEKDLFVVDALGWQQDDSSECTYYIKQGYLYYQDGTQVGTLQGWTAISGYSTSTHSYSYAYGICNGELYQLYQATATKIETGGSGWTNISGDHVDYAYGICNGQLYALQGTTATKIETRGNGWTAVSGSSHSSTYAYGICNGELYQLYQATATKISTGGSGWTNISGYSHSSTYAYGICNGELYQLYQATATKISTGGSGWTNISGYSYSTYYYAYGICNGELYQLNRTTATKISTGGSGWTAISGFSATSHYYAYGICNGELYQLYQATATKISTGGSGWTAISGYAYYSSSFSSYAYGICNGQLYQLFGTTATLIGMYVYNSIGTSSSCSFLNTTQSAGAATNCEFINCENEALVTSSAKFCTFTNCKGSVPSGTYNVFWNCTGTIPATNNAQSTYNAENLLTLDADNSIARFINTGFYPAQGMQDVGQPPSPITDPQGYQNWIEQFGNFQPASNSFLKGLAPLDSAVLTDIEGTTRLDPTTPGAYETAAAEE